MVKRVTCASWVSYRNAFVFHLKKGARRAFTSWGGCRTSVGCPPRSLCTRVVWKNHIINPASSGPFFTKDGPHSCGGADCSPWQGVSFSAEAVCKSRPGGQAVGLPSQSRIWVVSELHLSCPVPPPWACVSVFLPLHLQPIQTRSAAPASLATPCPAGTPGQC